MRILNPHLIRNRSRIAILLSRTTRSPSQHLSLEQSRIVVGVKRNDAAMKSVKSLHREAQDCAHNMVEGFVANVMGVTSWHRSAQGCVSGTVAKSNANRKDAKSGPREGQDGVSVMEEARSVARKIVGKWHGGALHSARDMEEEANDAPRMTAISLRSGAQGCA